MSFIMKEIKGRGLIGRPDAETMKKIREEKKKREQHDR